MLTFEQFQRAIQLDFSDVSDEGSQFECLVQELLQAKGFEAQRTGLGPDQGVDIIAEETTFDSLGIKQTRRYVVQCKHFAHSKKAVGTNEISDVIDTVIRHEANGYLLVASSDVTSSLRQKLATLNQASPLYTLKVWDGIALEQQLYNYPVLVAKYFPTRFQQIKITLPVPKGRRQKHVKDRILSHLEEYVGSKFIPKLYIRRYIEESLSERLLSPLDILKKHETDFSCALTTYISDVTDAINLPLLAMTPFDSSISFSWDHDVEMLRVDLLMAERALLSQKWQPVSDYVDGGAEALQGGFDSLNEYFIRYTKSVEAYLAPFLECANTFEQLEAEVSAKITRLENSVTPKQARKEYDEQWKIIEEEVRTEKRKQFSLDYADKAGQFTAQRYRKFIDYLVQEYLKRRQTKKALDKAVREKVLMGRSRPVLQWRGSEFLRKQKLIIREFDAKAVPFSQLKRQILSAKAALRNTPLVLIRGELRTLNTPIQIVVDIAGSGKTNICCRLALQLVNKAFVVFLTGKSLGKEFEDITEFLDHQIKDALQLSGKSDPITLIKQLQGMNYPLVLILDGINENTNPSKMKSNLKQLGELAKNTPVRILITSRTEYWEHYSEIFQSGSRVEITSGGLGKFSEEEQAIAIPVYLDHYKLHVRLESKAWDQLRRPLLLRFFCEAYGDPSRNTYRSIPPIKEVRLFRLFGEYCTVKYENIRNRLNANGCSVSAEDVEGVASFLGARCLRNRESTLRQGSLIRALARENPHALDIYRALLDEDIIIEETLERRNKELERHVSFVYEAFMEYLMARVLIDRHEGSDIRLSRHIKSLLIHEQHFLHIRGILAFLLPHCVGTYPITYSLILSQLRRSEFAESCVPAILNLWDCNWNVGIWPVLQAAAENFLSVPMDQVGTFVVDWLTEHDGEPFLNSVIENPKAIISIFGGKAARVVSGVETSRQKHILALLELTRTGSSRAVADDAVSVIGKLDPASAEATHPGESLFSKLLEAVVPILESIKYESRYSRDWSILVSLGAIGEQWSIDRSEIPEALTSGLESIVRLALFDELCLRQTLSAERKWWLTLLDIPLGEIEDEVEEWMAEPQFIDHQYFRS